MPPHGDAGAAADGMAPASAASAAVAFNCQDAAVVQRHFAGEPTWAFAGVFDGHGKYGKEAAAFVRDELPREIASDRSALRADPIAAVISATRRVHVRLLDAKSADGPGKNMSFSGTTACFVLSLGGDCRTQNCARQCTAVRMYMRA